MEQNPEVNKKRTRGRQNHEAESTQRGNIVGLMLKLHKGLPKAETPHEQESLQRQIAATDKQIDALVYELYGLTEEEIGTVEGGQK